MASPPELLVDSSFLSASENYSKIEKKDDYFLVSFPFHLHFPDPFAHWQSFFSVPDKVLRHFTFHHLLFFIIQLAQGEANQDHKQIT
jgi:hypothetical protein